MALIYGGCIHAASEPAPLYNGPSVRATAEGPVFGRGLNWSENEPWNLPECRRFFLLGMMDRSSFLPRNATGFETFLPEETRAEAIYGTVARLYARDLGVNAADLQSDAWKGAVVRSLPPLPEGERRAPSDLKLLIAYLAGLHARHGTPEGFAFSGGMRGIEVGGILVDGGIDGVRVEAWPGFPGASRITLIGRNGARPQLLTLLDWVEAGVQKESDPKSTSDKTNSP